MSTPSRDFRRVIEQVEAADFTSYIFQYPPLAVWDRWDGDESRLKGAWARTAGRENDLGLYVHVPFCKTKCAFCRFFVIEGGSPEERDDYVASLGREAALWAPLFASRRFSTLYFGGGTPSLLNCRQMEALFAHLRANFSFTEDRQICFEANPEFLDEEKLRFLREAGVDRLTIGVQSLDDRVTALADRTQTNQSVGPVYEMARRAGIPTINIDLMTGLPGQTLKNLQATIEEVARWRPDMIHICPFLPTDFTRFSQQGMKFGPASVSRGLLMEKRVVDYFFSKGYRSIPYDAIGLSDAAANRQLKDSVVRDMPFLGLGPGAVSCAPGEIRHVNMPHLGGYGRSVGDGRFPIFKSCFLLPEDDRINYALNHFWYGHVSRNDFAGRFKAEFEEAFPGPIAALAKKRVIGHNESDPDIWILRERSMSAHFEVRKGFYGTDVVNAVLEGKPLGRVR